MAIYTVLAPDTGDPETAFGDPMRVVFVKERGSWPAFFFPGLWLIYHRMWLVLIGYLVVALAITIMGAPLGPPYPSLILLAIHLLFTLEANELRRWTLVRNGYRLIGIAEGRGVEEAEIRFFSRFEGALPEPPAAMTPPPPPAHRPVAPMPRQTSAEAGDVVGLFPTPSGQPT